MNAKLSAVAMIVLPILAIGCSCSHKAGCSSCRSNAPTASVVREAPAPVVETTPASASVPAPFPIQ